MAYDKTLDVELAAFEKDTLHVSIRSYDGGAPKVQISRRIVTDKKTVFAKLGRLTADELQWLTEIGEQVLETLRKLIFPA